MTDNIAFYNHQVNKKLYNYPIQWWNRVTDIANVKIFPHQSFSAHIHRRLIPDNGIGSIMLDVLFNFEESFPNFFAKHFQQSIIVLTKKKQVFSSFEMTRTNESRRSKKYINNFWFFHAWRQIPFPKGVNLTNWFQAASPSQIQFRIHEAGFSKY